MYENGQSSGSLSCLNILMVWNQLLSVWICLWTEIYLHVKYGPDLEVESQGSQCGGLSLVE